jgi:hypothetical protein
MRNLKEKMENSFCSLVSDCETPDTPSKELPNGNAPQPPSGPIRPNNIRRPLGRVSSEQSLNSIESTKENFIIISRKKELLDSLASLYQTRSPESSNVSFESGYDSNNIAQPIHPSQSSSNMERK